MLFLIIKGMLEFLILIQLPELLPLIHENQDDITELRLIICAKHPEEC